MILFLLIQSRDRKVTPIIIEKEYEALTARLHRCSYDSENKDCLELMAMIMKVDGTIAIPLKFGKFANDEIYGDELEAIFWYFVS